jgi:hypothetical protein
VKRVPVAPELANANDFPNRRDKLPSFREPGTTYAGRIPDHRPKMEARKRGQNYFN